MQIKDPNEARIFQALKVELLPHARRSIPEDLKRQVRQKCGFGCIFCGIPFFQYDHLVEQAQGGEDTVENLNLLCATHHDQKTRGQISREAVRIRSVNPANKNKSRTSGYALEINNSTAIFDIGSNIFEHDFDTMHTPFRGLVIGGRDFVSANSEDGWLKFDITITNDWGHPLLSVESGELHAWTGVWDYNLVGPKITVQEIRSKISIELSINEDRITLARGRFAHGSLVVEVRPNHCILGPDVFAPPMARPRRGQNNILRDCRFKNNAVGVVYD